MRKFARFIFWILASLGGLVTLSIIGIVGASFYFKNDAAKVEYNSVLWLDLTGVIPERQETGGFFGSSGQASFLQHLQALEAAQSDDRIVAVAAEIGPGGLGLGQIQELRSALQNFSQISGKKSYVFAEDLGAMGNGMLSYYLASAFSEIWLSPTGGVGINGLAIEIPYFKDALEKFSITAEMEQRHEFKGGADPFIRSAMTEPVKSSLQSLLEQWQGQISKDILISRFKISPDFNALVNNSPYLAAEAKQMEMVDRLAYLDEFETFLKYLGSDNDVTFIDVASYQFLTSQEEQVETETSLNIAVIQGIGPITGEDYGPGYYSDQNFSPYTVAESLSQARENPNIDGVIFRVSSPGGAYAQSDMVRREILRFQTAEKPIVVSMGNNAASGGYFVSMAADHIVAQPGTLTGSIGVYAGKIASEQFWKSLGVNWERVETGPQAGMWSMVTPFSQSQREKFQKSLDFVYKDFSGKAATDRNLTNTEIDAAARGRIWTGMQAQQQKLVDSLGGYKQAITILREKIDKNEDSIAQLIVYPRQPGPFEQIQAFMQADDITHFLSLQLSHVFMQEYVPQWVQNLTQYFSTEGMLLAPPVTLTD